MFLQQYKIYIGKVATVCFEKVTGIYTYTHAHTCIISHLKS